MISIVIHGVLLLVLPPLLLGVINKTKAWFGGRIGAPLLQPYYDLFKLLRKGMVLSVTTTWIFVAGPALRGAALDGETAVHVVLTDRGEEQRLDGTGNGPIAAFCDALSGYGVDVRVLDYVEHAMSSGGDAAAASYLECAVGGRVLWGVGIDPSIVTSSLKGIVSAVNRAERDAPSA